MPSRPDESGTRSAIRRSSPPNPRRKTHRAPSVRSGARAFGLSIAALLLLLAQRVDASTLDYSDTSILVQSEIRVSDDSSNAALRIPDGLVLPAGTFGDFETLIEPEIGSSRYPTSASSLPGGFISARMTTDLKGAVGVSGIGALGEDWLATAHFGQTVTNRILPADPDETFPIVLELHVSAGEVSYWTGAGDPVSGALKSAANLGLAITERNGAGSFVRFVPLFSAIAYIEKRAPRGGFIPGGGLVGLGSSPVLDFPSQAHARTFDIQAPGRGITRVAGIRWDEFSVSYVVDLPPGHTIDVSYDMDAGAFMNIPDARVVLDDHVYGSQAMIGDPFNLSGSAGGSITIGTVPEPNFAALLSVGLGALALLGRRRCALRGTSRPNAAAISIALLPRPSGSSISSIRSAPHCG